MKADDEAAETAGDAAEPISADELARQLSRLRQRGLAFIDSRRQGRVDVPLIELLARRHTSDTRLSRIALIHRLLQDGLRAFEAKGHQDDAEFVRWLFFDEGEAAAISRQSAGDLLADARKHSPLKEDKFDSQRRDIFLTFADFLLGFIPPDVEIEPLPEVPRRRWRWLLLYGLICSLVIAAIIGFIVYLLNSRNHNQQGGPSTSNLNKQKSYRGTSSSVVGPRLTFDDLGGGSSIIRVYSGVKDIDQDKTANGTYRNGETVTALCKVNGRLITSDTSVGERSVQSSIWIKIAGSPGVQQYAPLTYATIPQAQLDALPDCTDAP